MTNRWLVPVVLMLSVMLGVVRAQADVVGPPPTNCPPGSTPSSSHSGPLCAPTGACMTNADCTMGATCMEAFQCIETRSCGGRVPPDSANKNTKVLILINLKH